MSRGGKISRRKNFKRCAWWVSTLSKRPTGDETIESAVDVELDEVSLLVFSRGREISITNIAFCGQDDRLSTLLSTRDALVMFSGDLTNRKLVDMSSVLFLAPIRTKMAFCEQDDGLSTLLSIRM